MLRARGHFTVDDRLRRALPRLVLAAALMGAGLWLGWHGAAGLMQGGWLARVTLLTVLLGASAFLYAVAVLATGAVRRADLLAQLRLRR